MLISTTVEPHFGTLDLVFGPSPFKTSFKLFCKDIYSNSTENIKKCSSVKSYTNQKQRLLINFTPERCKNRFIDWSQQKISNSKEEKKVFHY